VDSQDCWVCDGNHRSSFSTPTGTSNARATKKIQIIIIIINNNNNNNNRPGQKDLPDIGGV